MSEEQQKSTQTLGKGILVILWIMAVFTVMIMYDIKTNLESINSKITSLSRSSAMQNPCNLQIVDAKDGKTPVYFIQRIADPEMAECCPMGMSEKTAETETDVEPTATTKPAS